MKFDKNKAFPYPVLRPYCDDYVDAEFQVSVEPIIEESIISMQIGFLCSSPEITDQISIGNATYAAIVSCRDTYFRKVITSQANSITETFPVNYLRGEVKVEPYVVVIKDIDGFTSEDINPEYGGMTFSFSPGDILAQDEPQIFYIERDLFKPVSSVVDLVKSDNLSGGEWRVGLTDDHIQIQVGSSMKEALDDARNTKSGQAILINSIYLSAITHALSKLKETPDEFEGHRWADVIKMQLHNHGWELASHEPYEIAQRLMKYPMTLLEAYVFKGNAE